MAANPQIAMMTKPASPTRLARNSFQLERADRLNNVHRILQSEAPRAAF
jgi:hypothetical protein